MTTANEEILDRYIRHQTYLLRYVGGLRNRLLPYLIVTESDLYDAIVAWVSRVPDRQFLAGPKGRDWQKNFERILRGVRRKAWRKVEQDFYNEMLQLSVNEAAGAAATIQGAVPVTLNMALPTAAQLHAIVNSFPFEGQTLKEWVAITEEADVRRMLRYAKVGITQGKTPTQMAREIIGTKAAGYRDSQARKAFKDLESVLLTLTNGIQNEAKQALYEANSDLIKEELYVATLDVNTTIECAGNDGKLFKRGEGPIPPLHFRCRSLRVPYINPDNLGNRGFDSSTEKELLQEYSKATNIGSIKSRDDLPYGHKTSFDAFARKRRREMMGQVPGRTTYNDWLKKQTKDFQDRVLGPTRAEMFRKGEISLDKFIARDGDTLTLEELRQLGYEIPTDG